MVKGKRYSVKWIDTFSYPGWWHEKDMEIVAKENAEYLETIGFYIGEAHGFIALAATKNGMEGVGKWGYPKWIPKGCIKKVRLLR